MPEHCERDVFPSERSTIHLAAIVAGVGAMAAYADEDGSIPNGSVAEAFKDGLSAALAILRITTSGETQQI